MDQKQEFQLFLTFLQHELKSVPAGAEIQSSVKSAIDSMEEAEELYCSARLEREEAAEALFPAYDEEY